MQASRQAGKAKSGANRFLPGKAIGDKFDKFQARPGRMQGATPRANGFSINPMLNAGSLSPGESHVHGED